MVGASSFSMGHGANALKKVASVRMLNHTSDAENVVSYPLKKRVGFSILFLHVYSDVSFSMQISHPPSIIFFRDNMVMRRIRMEVFLYPLLILKKKRHQTFRMIKDAIILIEI